MGISTLLLNVYVSAILFALIFTRSPPIMYFNILNLAVKIDKFENSFKLKTLDQIYSIVAKKPDLVKIRN
ncbi:hypothetical protein KIMC2_04040 [Xylocopilactobacillus apis]|uniref:Uncharacterized protein n=1 Tax=Xylocopilactobacillus apis TaxID=2932183 RepID=A0AAU9DGJ0_9LACO|nr:hypothetical protein KIMC2_04040 [Xylocopilactobacillus apis]